MRSIDVDVAIIGAGTAGLNARRAALAGGASRVVMIEGGAHGTMCARVGCMPSKLLIAASEAAHEPSRAQLFGIHIHPPKVDGPAVMHRIQRERDRFVGFVLDAVRAIPEGQKITGYARFVGPTTLEVGDHTRVQAQTVVIAVGSSPYVPPQLATVGQRLLTNDSIFELPDLPRSVAVMGTGVIGLELGQAMHRLGVRVTIFNRSRRVGPLRDPELQTVACRDMGRELDLRLGIRGVHGEARANTAEIGWSDAEGREHKASFDRVLCALGRRPAWERLNLRVTDVELDHNEHPCFDPHTMQCGDSPIFVAGDFVGEKAILHEAADEGRFAGANAATYPDVRAYARRTPLTMVFSDPQIAVVGTPFANLNPDTVRFGDVSYEDQGRARVMGKNRGMVRIYGERRTRRLLAAEMFGPSVEHTAHLLAWSIQQQMSVDAALEMPFYHPVVEEGIRTALRDLKGKLDTKP
ncbi:MAG: dihydrolipoyl dehydrogenase [Nannocystaceae bacterium]